jgi:hypothetical protein
VAQHVRVVLVVGQVGAVAEAFDHLGNGVVGDSTSQRVVAAVAGP